MSAQYIETHCHLDYLEQLPLEDILQSSREKGIEKIITIAVEPGNLATVMELVDKFPMIYGTQGIHPHDAKKSSPQALATIRENAQKHPKIVAIGEIGLDYHYDNSPRDKQREVFKQQLNIAAKLDLPVVIHSRDADQDTMEILQEHAPSLRRKGVIHSFTSGKELALKALELGFYLGFNGIITFKNAHQVREIVALTPVERILLETDSPFLTPVPFRGKENAPFYLPYVADKVLELKGLEQTELDRFTQNAYQLFNLT